MPDANDIIDGLMREASLSKAIFHAAEAGLDLDVRGVRFVHECNLDSENAKLRELVADLAICACGKYCYGCPHQYDGCDRDERLRELGIEVTE